MLSPHAQPVKTQLDVPCAYKPAACRTCDQSKEQLSSLKLECPCSARQKPAAILLRSLSAESLVNNVCDMRAGSTSPSVSQISSQLQPFDAETMANENLPNENLPNAQHSAGRTSTAMASPPSRKPTMRVLLEGYHSEESRANWP